MENMNLVNLVASSLGAKLSSAPNPGDYVGPDTGLLMCGRCGEPRQLMARLPHDRIMPRGWRGAASGSFARPASPTLD